MSGQPGLEEAGNANASLMLDRRIEQGDADRPAYFAGEQTLTYGELMSAVARMGNLLLGLGVRREERVLLVLDDTPLFPAAFIGALRIGAVPVPVSLREHPENFRHFITDSYARLVICDEPTVPVLREALRGLPVTFLAPGGEDVLELDRVLREQDDELSPVDTHPDDMAFWLYTSGSTGRPKGVVHVHKTIPVTCEAFARHVMELKEQDRVFSSTKLYHAYGLANGLSYPLYYGSSTVLMSGPPTPDRLIETLRRHRPTVYCSVPALYRHLLDDPDAEGAFDSVRRCISAAEPLPVRTFEQWRERFGQEILDGIGATEMVVSFCSNMPGDVAPGTTGRPIPGYELRLLDEQGRVVQGPGEGALQVRGESRAACYWHQQERTRRTMQGEWLATGDRFRRRADGRYEYVGRVDDMLKVGGLWVSPVDMEHVMLEHAEVEGVAVTGVLVEDYMRLAAFVQVAAHGSAEDRLGSELRQLCRERLRDYEQPHLIRFVTELPRTANGKPRRFMLREELQAELAPSGPAGAQATGASSTADTRDLATMPAEQREQAVLQMVVEETAAVLASAPETIDPGQRFVSLGLDSLMAVELRNRLAGATNLQLPSTLAFDHPTPADAAAAVLARMEGREAPARDSASEREELASLGPMPRTKLPPARLSIRITTSTLVQGIAPPRLAVMRAERRSGLIWERSRAERDESMAAMRAIVAGTDQAGRVEELARRHLTERLAHRALFWQRPWTAGIDPASATRVRQALDSGRGVLLSSCHLGPYFRLERARPFRGRRTYLVPGPWFFDEPSHDLWGRRLARWRNGTVSIPVRATGSFRVIQALLERGEAVFVFFDMPGPRQTRFLGKPAMLAEGTAQLSARTGALVLPLRARREHHRVLVQAGEPLDPREHDGPDGLHEALAAVHEAWILENPAAMEDPREIGWGDGAGPQVWVAPNDG